jgi:putative ABC transport system permease protein
MNPVQDHREPAALLRSKGSRITGRAPFRTLLTIFQFAVAIFLTIGALIGLAVFISCLGLFGLSAYVAAQKTKEIGIRKVLGAKPSEIVMLLSKDFFRWVLLANIFAWPAAYYASVKWLQGFAYRVRLGAGPFLLASVTALLVALLTVSYQSVKAATANPADAIRYE